ncbi:unnamed protein product [Alopecurus aequalis]
MGTEKATTTVSSGKAPALNHVRARPRTSKVLGLDPPSCPSTPPLRSRITVPFLWEDAPGKPKLREAAANTLFFHSAAAASPLPDDGGATVRAGGDREYGAVARPAPLKLPPRLQAAARPEYSFSSPKTVLQGPYVRGGGEKPPRPVRRSGSMTSCRLMLGAGGGAFSWRKATAPSACDKKDGHDHDTSCCSPAASSSASPSSSSSSSMSYFFNVHSRGSGHWQQADGRDDSKNGDVGDDDAKGSVRITRFRRNRSLPNISTSHLWHPQGRQAD